MRVRSELPGRIRWESARILNSAAVALHLESSLKPLEFVTAVVANPLTGRLLVCFDHGIPRDQMGACVREALEGFDDRERLDTSRRGLGSSGERLHFTARRIVGVTSLLLCLPPLAASLLVGVHSVPLVAGLVSLRIAVGSLMRLLRVGSARHTTSEELQSDDLKALYAALEPSSRALVLAAVLGGCSVALALAPFAILAFAATVIAGGVSIPIWLGGASSGFVFFLLLTAASLLALLAKSACEYAGQILWRNSGETVMHRLRMRAYAHVQRAEAGFFVDESPGAVLAQLGEDINQVEKVFNGVWEFVQIVVGLSLVSSVLIVVVPNFAWAVLLLVPAFVAATRRLRNRIVPLYRAVREESASLSADISSSLDGLVTVKTFAAEGRVLEQIDKRSNRVRQLARPAIAAGAGFRPLFELVAMTGVVVVAIVGAVAAGTLFDFAIYAAVVLVVRELLWPLSQLGVALEMYQRGLASYRRAVSVLEAPIEALDEGRPLPLHCVRGELELRGVGFGYRDGHPLLENVSIRVPAGTTTAIVGPSGAGKTTLLKLLLRFYPATQGDVLLDGEDIDGLRLDHLRRAISVVSQEVFLFDGTILDNLRFARPEATDEEVERAATDAELHDFILSLPEGYASRVGQRGMRLSGGQRQRLALARVLLRGSPIVFLDEATSHIDNQTEAALQESMLRALRGRTVVSIAHRLSTIAGANEICVLDTGRLIERGTHDELLARGGAYASLWQLQARQQCFPTRGGNRADQGSTVTQFNRTQS